MVAFDWYSATIRDEADVVLDQLATHLGGEVVSGTPHQGYTLGSHIKVKGSNVATVYSGGRNGFPHAFASSDDTPAFVELVRALWGESVGQDGRLTSQHHVTRMDACIDFDGPGTFDRVTAIGKYVADFDARGEPRRRPLAITYAGDWYRGEAGRTMYVGSKKSAVFVRIYEKGHELRARAIDPAALSEISLDLVRVEVVVRPEGVARFRAASCAPVDAFGYAQWTRELLAALDGGDVERVHIRERRESDDERSLYWLVKQYGEHLANEARRVGGWENLGPALFDRMTSLGVDVDPVADLSVFRDRPSAGQNVRKSGAARATPRTDRPF